MIAAVAENNALGKDNNLVWHLPDDFRRFKELTSGHPIIMGRKTFESFPKLLPNRTHIIITRQKNYQPEHCIVVDSIEKALEFVPEEENAFIIGGGEIYKQSLDYTDVIELTRVHDSFDADTYFPEINPDSWQLVEEEYHPKDEKHLVDFTYQTFIRK
ncbi:dihydrofolate reductase [Flavobacterium lacus]|uniref:Dihydrofolate reductase n=2 Tax=Flavobacterium lacus TaxID=1353778 RepID=A0A328WYA3_9FLAO|nr:dihydrofolate reductase [Flavobacterium lacus]